MRWFNKLWEVRPQDYYCQSFEFKFNDCKRATLDHLYWWSNGHFGCDTTDENNKKFWIDDPYQQKRLHFKVGNTIIRNEDHSFGIE